jgi:hypothetical protein
MTGPENPKNLAARALEDAFFLEQDRVLIEKLRAMTAMAETKDALAAASGITNDAVCMGAASGSARRSAPSSRRSFSAARAALPRRRAASWGWDGFPQPSSR